MHEAQVQSTVCESDSVGLQLPSAARTALGIWQVVRAWVLQTFPFN